MTYDEALSLAARSIGQFWRDSVLVGIAQDEADDQTAADFRTASQAAYDADPERWENFSDEAFALANARYQTKGA